MLAVFIYGLGWICLLSGIFGYEIKFINTVLISFFSYFITITLFRNKKRSLISLASLMLLSVGGFVAMTILGNKDLLMNNISAFLTPYFESITDVNSSIDIPRQAVVVFLLSIFIYFTIFKLKNVKYSGHACILISIITLTVGFVENTLNSMNDRYAFLLFVFCSIIYYFHIFHSKNDQKEKRNSMPFITIAVIYAISIIGISQMLFKSTPYPFQAKPKASSSSSSKSIDPYQKFIYEVSNSGNIRDNFVFDGIELFRVKTIETKYFKSIVYDRYENNKWLQNEDLQKTENRVFNTFKEFGETESVVVNYTNIQSPVLFAGPYIDNFTAQDPNIIIARDENRGTYRIENYTTDITKKDIIFSFDSLNILDSSAFKETLRKVKLQNTNPQYEGFDNERIHELALEITEGLDNDYDKIEAIIHYLKDNYTYNPAPKVPKDNSDKIEFFLFESKEGFCQHYSSSAALMLKSLNIPARYVTGFKIDTSLSFSSGPSYYKYLASGYKPVFDSDAHAWIEVYFKDYGWVMFECTLVDTENQNTNTNLPEEEEEPFVEDNNANQEVATLIKIVLYIGIPIVLIFLIYTIIKIRKSKNAFHKGTNNYRVKIIHQITLEYLKACKYPKHNYETPQEYAKRIDAEFAANELNFSALILTYDKIVYGDYEADTEFVDIYYAFLRQMKKMLKKRCKFHNKVKLFIKEFVST